MGWRDVRHLEIFLCILWQKNFIGLFSLQGYNTTVFILPPYGRKEAGYRKARGRLFVPFQTCLRRFSMQLLKPFTPEARQVEPQDTIAIKLYSVKKYGKDLGGYESRPI